jgi:hypothetical protein
VKKKNEDLKFRSMMEFEKKYLPKSYEEKLRPKPKDAQALGASMAKETLQKVKKQLIGR